MLFSTSKDFFTSSRWVAALNVLACRGPDQVGEFVSEQWAAGHTRLAIIGLGSAGTQPVIDPLCQSALMYNGEILNYRDLASEIGIDASSDTEVLWSILRSKRLDYLSKIRGMFAFVYWDSKSQTITTGRDYFGIKPLYLLRHRDGEVSFSSVPSALVQSENRPTPDAEAITGFVATGLFPEGRSAFSGISKLPPGVIQTWSRSERGWSPLDHRLTLTDWARLTVEDSLTDSVKAHLTADVPVGVLLSGGVDSTLIAAIAREYQPEICTFSLITPSRRKLDEGAIARWNAQLLQTNHREIEITPGMLSEELESIIRSSGEPISDPALLPLSLLCREASRHIKVVLAGEGGDELFGGYRRYALEAQLANPSRSARAMRYVSAHLLTDTRFLQVLPSQYQRALVALLQGEGFESHMTLLFGEIAAVQAAFPNSNSSTIDYLKGSWAKEDRLDLGFPDYQSFDVYQWMANVFLEKSDRSSMAHGLEIRVPFLDPLVARSVQGLRSRSTDKEPLRKMLQALLPDVHLPERKMGLTIDVESELINMKGREVIQEMLFSPDSILHKVGLENPVPIVHALKTNKYLAFRLLTLEMWDRLFIR